MAEGFIYIHTLAMKNVMEKQTGETVHSLSDTGCNAKTGWPRVLCTYPGEEKIMEKQTGETVQSLSNTGCKAEGWPRGYGSG